MATQQHFIKRMRPALIVGLGGTGQQVLTKVKARFLETFGQDALSVVKLASLDTRDEKLEEKLDNGRMVRLDNNTELLDIGNVKTLQVLQNLDSNFPQIKAWLPDNLPSQSITAGAKQIRPLGRLAFFFHFSKIRNYLDGLINQLANINRDYEASAVRAEGAAGLQIFLISSVCGGTGSGIFLDTAFLMHHLCNRLGQPKVDLTGILVLPQAFTQVPSNQILANAYAALSELDQFSSGSLGNNFDVEYPGRERVVVSVRPFSICYLVDGLNEAGRTLAGLNELAPMIAESIFLQISSTIGQRAASAFDNLRTINDPNPHFDDKGKPHLTIYSGFGMSSLHFPARKIIDVCGQRFAYRLIKQGLFGQQPTNESIQAAVTSTLDTLDLREDQLLDRIRRDDRGNLLTINPAMQGLSLQAVEGVDTNQIPTKLQSLAETFEIRELGDTIRKFIDTNTKNLRHSLVQSMDERISRLMDDTLTGGLLLIDPFVEALRANLSETRESMRVKLANAQKELGQVDIDARLRQLNNALQAFFDITGSKRKTAINALINEYTRKFLLRYDIMTYDAAIQIVSVVISHIEDQQKETITLIGHLNYAADRFHQSDEEKTRRWESMQDALDQIITNSQDLEQMYQDYVTDVRQQLNNLIEESEAGAIHTWRKRYPTVEEISEMLMRFVMKVFEPIGRIRLEDEILRKREEKSPTQWLEDLRSTSIPFWSINTARVPEGGASIEPITIVAVEDQETSIYKDNLVTRGTVGTTTLDRHRLTVLQTKHGVPLFALAHINDYRRVYDQYMRQQSVPLHLFPQPDIQLGQSVFALAEALGLVEQQGVKDYVLHLPDESREQVLGDGLTAAMNSFVVKSALVSQTERNIEEHILTMGKDAAAARIEAYTKSPISADPERAALQRELHRMAGEYRQKYLI